MKPAVPGKVATDLREATGKFLIQTVKNCSKKHQAEKNALNHGLDRAGLDTESLLKIPESSHKLSRELTLILS
jgi:hypothetical protein